MSTHYDPSTGIVHWAVGGSCMCNRSAANLAHKLPSRITSVTVCLGCARAQPEWNPVAELLALEREREANQNLINSLKPSRMFRSIVGVLQLGRPAMHLRLERQGPRFALKPSIFATAKEGAFMPWSGDVAAARAFCLEAHLNLFVERKS